MPVGKQLTNKMSTQYLSLIDSPVKPLQEIEYLQILTKMPKNRQVFAARFFRATGDFYRFYIDAGLKAGLPQSWYNVAQALHEKMINESETKRGQSAKEGACVTHPVDFISCCCDLMRKK